MFIQGQELWLYSYPVWVPGLSWKLGGFIRSFFCQTTSSRVELSHKQLAPTAIARHTWLRLLHILQSGRLHAARLYRCNDRIPRPISIINANAISLITRYRLCWDRHVRRCSNKTKGQSNLAKAHQVMCHLAASPSNPTSYNGQNFPPLFSPRCRGTDPT